MIVSFFRNSIKKILSNGKGALNFKKRDGSRGREEDYICIYDLSSNIVAPCRD